MDNVMRVAPYILSFAIGFALAFLFFKPKIVENIVVKTETRIDTIFTAHVDTVFLTDTVLQHHIDTVYYSVPFEATVSVYSGSKVLDYGSIDWMAETTGKLVNLSFTPSFDIPTITKEIETVRTITKTRDLRGLYAGASASLDLDYKIGASYMDRDWQFNYDYQPKAGMHWVGVKRRVF